MSVVSRIGKQHHSFSSKKVADTEKLGSKNQKIKTQKLQIVQDVEIQSELQK